MWKNAQGHLTAPHDRPWAVNKTREQRVKDSGYVNTKQWDKPLKEAGIRPCTSTRTRNHPDYDSQRSDVVKQNCEYTKRRRTEEHLVDLILGMNAGERWEIIGHAKKICHFSIMNTCQDNRCPYHHITDFEKRMFEEHLQSSMMATQAQQDWYYGNQPRAPWSNWQWSENSSSSSFRSSTWRSQRW